MWLWREKVKKSLQLYCLKKWKHKVVISKMRKCTKGKILKEYQKFIPELLNLIYLLTTLAKVSSKQIWVQSQVETQVKDINLCILDSILVIRLDEIPKRICTHTKNDNWALRGTPELRVWRDLKDPTKMKNLPEIQGGGGNNQIMYFLKAK